MSVIYDEMQVPVWENNPYENVEHFGLDYQNDEEAEAAIADGKKYDLEDGYWVMRNNCGGINLRYWASITGYTVDQLLILARGKYIWQDAAQYELSNGDKYAGWLPKEQFLVGNRVQKLKDTIRIQEEMGGGFEHEIELLQNNMPEEVRGEEIFVSLGAPWINSIAGFIGRFIAQLLGLWMSPKVIYSNFLGKWVIEEGVLQFFSEVLNNTEYGTSRMSAIIIIEHKLNGKAIKVFDRVPRLDRNGEDLILNEAETVAAREKARKIDIRFHEYCHKDKQNEALLQEAFVNRFGYGLCKFDGSRFDFADCSKKIHMHKHQKDAVAQALSNRNVLFADAVGAGKTLEYACAVHELLRLCIVKKVVVVVPNVTLDAVFTTYNELFPMDRVLLVRPKKEFAPANRKKTFELMKTNEYEVVFMAYSSFDMLTLSKRVVFDKRDEELRECARQIMRAQTQRHRASLKSHLKRLKQKNKKFKEKYKDTEMACFDELGFDMIVVDEAHNYKNISLDFTTESVVGMHVKGSKKADNMLDKVEYIQMKQGRILFATGTPITNSLVDLYVMMRFLMPDEMKLCEIFNFKDWLKTFCEEEHTFEVDVDGKNCRFRTRFSKFHNLTELMSMFSEVCHFYQGDDNELDLPTFNGYTDIVIKKSERQKQYIDQLADRAEEIRAHRVNSKEDNFLKITVNGRACALDERLVYETDSCANEESKIMVCRKNVAHFYFLYPNTGQIIFCDSSTPKETFNVYDEMKKELVKIGVPEEHIAFIHDADSDVKRAKMEKAFNKGTIRILLGSTQKLGTGTNVQERLVAVHHLDIPWKPGDMVQREGRILRPGNKCEEVFIFRYPLEASFDAYTYQLLENKQRFISQFLAGSLNSVHRDETDCADTVLDYAEIKALAIGNPLIKERVEVANKLEHARIKQRKRRKELQDLEEFLLHLPERMEKRRMFISNTKADISFYKKHKESVSKVERRDFGEELLFALKDNVMMETERVFSVYQGFEVVLPKYMQNGKPYILLRRKGSNLYSVKMDTEKALGCCQRLDNRLETLSKVLEEHCMKLKDYVKQQAEAKNSLANGNVYNEEVEKLAAHLRVIDKKLKEEK